MARGTGPRGTSSGKPDGRDAAVENFVDGHRSQLAVGQSGDALVVDHDVARHHAVDEFRMGARHVEPVPGAVIGKGLLAGQHGLRCRRPEDADIVGTLGDEPLEAVVVVA